MPSLLHDAKNMLPTGSAYSQALRKNYVAQSEFEVRQNNCASVGVFAHGAIVAGGSNSILPEAITKRTLPAATVGELTNARNRLAAAHSFDKTGE